MKIYLVRHGQTEENYQHKIQGLTNTFLNDTGRRQCQKLRQEIFSLSFDVCYVSPLIRTVETAMILIGDRVEMIPDKRLVERGLGQLENQDMKLYDPFKYWDYEGNCGDLGVEKIQDIFARSMDFLKYVLLKHEGEDILIVTHGAVFRALRCLLLKQPLKGNLFDPNVKIDNCCFQEFSVSSDDLLHSLSLNDFSKKKDE